MTDRPPLNSDYCPLCGATNWSLAWTDARRDYIRCATCDLVRVPANYFLAFEDELRIYQAHQNVIGDPAYCRFLNRVFDPVMAMLPPGSYGLDFGCGPGPALAAMFREAGHLIDLYDPFFANDLTVFQRQFDFITSTEVFEHLFDPRFEIDRLWTCLRPGGLLAAMTKRQNVPADFPDWFYTRDPTHVSFFSDQTFSWLADYLPAELSIVSSDVVILVKPADTDYRFSSVCRTKPH